MARKLLGLSVVALLVLGGTAVHAGVAAPALCKDKKAKATGKQTLDLLKAFGANVKKKNVAKLGADVSKAQSKLSKGFTKAEFTGKGDSRDCDTNDDVGTIENKVELFVADVIEEISPTTTTVTMSTTTTTMTSAVELQGALLRTVGRFTYNLTLGLPGADAACSTNFPGTHACEYSELLIAEGAGDLVGLQDVGANTVTSFWVIDRSNNADIHQCNDDSAMSGTPVPGANWEYPTADTPSRGRRVDLNNGAGTLGAIQAPQQCNFSQRWVGCCL
jgi:hypothetical protein